MQRIIIRTLAAAVNTTWNTPARSAVCWLTGFICDRMAERNRQPAEA